MSSVSDQPPSSHSALTRVRGAAGSRARWANQPQRRIIVFVHGFNGTAVGTWKGFDEMLPLDPRAAGVDLFFYGYDTFVNDIKTAARRLFELLKRFHADRNSLIPSRSFEIPSSGYENILICAHSLGGVVVRWALLHAHKHSEPWVDNVALVLFAPAHLAVSNNATSRIGAKLSEPVRQMLGRFTLEVLHRETEFATKGQGIANALTPKAILQAGRDKWVMIGGYEHDPTCVLARDATHTSICKPTSSFVLPIEVVLSVLSKLQGGT